MVRPEEKAVPFLVYLPPQEKLHIQPTVEFRERIERRNNRDFSDAPNDDRTDFLTRVRVGAIATLDKQWKFSLQYQYARDWIHKASGHSVDEASDLSLGYAQHIGAEGTATLGRQKIVLGSERLIGPLEWTNLSRPVDGFRFQSKDWDAFVFKFGVGETRPLDARVAGVARTWKEGLSSFIYKHDQVNGRSIDLGTVSHWTKRKYGQWTFDLEAAIQFGENKGRHQRAWAWHSSASHPLSAKTSGFLEFNAASGGSNSDNVFTFDNLYPTNHKFYGSMDMQAWKNMNEISAGVIHQLTAKSTLSFKVYSYSLRDASDAWYGAAGSANKGKNGDFIDPTGASGKNVGTEFDLEGTYAPRKDVQFSGGLGLFKPGSFVKSRNGGTADDQLWFYVQVSIRF
ncbi:MAG: alginate export family protein [Armatimonadetes bacterium]|nr:alginate export family protein [Armatimonadota bacterium]